MGEKLLFAGAGAMGSFVGGMLAERGHEVTLIDGWPEHIRRIKESGLRISGTHGEKRVSVNALHVHEVQRLARGSVNVAFITAKAYDSEWSAALIKDSLTPEALVVSLQNGFNEARIERILERTGVIGCIATQLGTEIVEAGHVTRAYRPGGEEYDVFRAGLASGEINEGVEHVVRLLAQVDASRATTNLYGERWAKLVANAVANPLSAVTGLRDREMSLDARVRAVAIRLGIEGVAVGRGIGYELPPVFGIDAPEWADARRAELDVRLAKMGERATDQGRPSTPVDIALGRRTELEFFNGLIIAKGAELGIPTPTHEAVMRLVGAVERGELTPSVANLEKLREGTR